MADRKWTLKHMPITQKNGEARWALVKGSYQIPRRYDESIEVIEATPEALHSAELERSLGEMIIVASRKNLDNEEREGLKRARALLKKLETLRAKPGIDEGGSEV